MSNFVLNALLINLVTVGLGLKTFKAIRSCYGKAGCSYNNPDGIQKLADILDDLANVIPDCHRVNLCAFLCLSDKDCLGFNYLKDIDSCYFYHFYPNVIYYKKDCVYFETLKSNPYVVKENVNLAYGKKTCYSSMAVFNLISLGPHNLVDNLVKPRERCAQTSESPSGANWWMIDLEQNIQVGRVRVVTGNVSEGFSERLAGFIMGLTNISWFEKHPTRDNYSICAVNNYTMVPLTTYTYNCSQYTPPGRFIIIQQGVLNSTTPGIFMLCEVQVYVLVVP